MKKIFIRDDDFDFFKQSNTLSYDDFFSLKGDVVSKPGKSPVHRVLISSGEDHRTFYLKKGANFPFSTLLKRLRRGVGLHSDTYVEKEQVERYKHANIPVMHIAAWGEETVLGWPKTGFLIAAEVAGERLDRFVGPCDAQEKEQAFVLYGELIANMHNNGISEVARIQDIICASGNKIELTIIDREHGIPKSKKLSDHDRINGLARTYLKNLSALKAKTPMLQELRFLLNGYLGSCPNSIKGLQTLESQVKQEVQNLIGKKEKLKSYQWLLSSPNF